jgi:hypothetical protein
MESVRGFLKWAAQKDILQVLFELLLVAEVGVSYD